MGKSTHKLSHSPTWNSWHSMKARCYNKNHSAYSRYGGRGIKVCDSWLNSLENFVKDMGIRPDGMTLDRIDNDGNYTPDNCKWSTKHEQVINRRINRKITYKGRTDYIAQFAIDYGINLNTLHDRLRRGWSIDDAIERPVAKKLTNY